MKKIFALSASLAAFGLVLAPAAQAEDTMMKKDTMHMSKPAHHMKKDTMMHKDNMKGDKMMKDEAPKTEFRTPPSRGEEDGDRSLTNGRR